jgi:hypothetical protein
VSYSGAPCSETKSLFTRHVDGVIEVGSCLPLVLTVAAHLFPLTSPIDRQAARDPRRRPAQQRQATVPDIPSPSLVQGIPPNRCANVAVAIMTVHRFIESDG